MKKAAEKIVKKYVTRAALLCMAALAVTCEEKEQATLAIDSSADYIPSEGGAISLTVQASGKWTISKTTSWVKISATSGEGVQAITVTADSNMVANEDTPDRNATIYIIAGPNTETVKLVQRGYLQPTSPAPAIAMQQFECEVILSIDPVEYALAYRWYRDSVEVFTGPDTQYSVADDGTHTYTVTGVNITGNEGVWSAGEEVTMSTCPPPLEITDPITGLDANSCNAATGKGTVTLTAPRIAFADTLIWFWNGDSVVQKSPSRTLAARKSGDYTVEGYNAKGVSGRSPAKTVTITQCPLTVSDLVGSWRASGYYNRSGYNPISHTVIITVSAGNIIKIENFLEIKSVWASGINDYMGTVDLDSATVTIPVAKAGGSIFSGTGGGGQTILVGAMKSGDACNNSEVPVMAHIQRTEDELILDFEAVGSARNSPTVDPEEGAVAPCCMVLGITATGSCVGGGYATYGLKLRKAY
ncbi:MAG: BACON domain-containing protein [Prevotellaceae bacterium]|nr:BACON domain-containing protein [Prevotellaceae bacterium]